MMTADVQILVLDDGRTFAWREYGAQDGVPCLYVPGTPASGLCGEMFHDAALKAGVRWISLDKPGYGYSDHQPRRALLDWPKDVRALVDHLELTKFAVAGESGGGPHALAVVYALAERKTTVILLAGMGPFDPASIREMKRLNRLFFGLARRAPWALQLPMSAMGRALRDPTKSGQYLSKQLASSPPADAEIWQQPQIAPIFIAAAAEAFRQGAKGAVTEMRMLASPWGFRLEDVNTHVDLFQGELDLNVPVAIARTMAARLPDCSARFLPQYGHAVALPCSKEFMECIVTAAGSRQL